MFRGVLSGILSRIEKLSKPTDQQEQWRREIKWLRRMNFKLLSEDDRGFILIMEDRIRNGLPLHEQHGKRIDQIGALIQDLTAI